MTIEQANQLLAPHPTDGVQIVNGRYRLPHPDTGKPQLWSRVTTVVEALDDKQTLMDWRCRNTGIGVAKTPSLAAKFIGTDPADRKALKALVEAALDAAGANEKRELGTGLHSITERVDAGLLDPADVPEPWGAHVANYQRALRMGSLRPHPDYIERVVLNLPYGCVGKIDRLYVDHEDQLVVGDEKTGSYTAWLKWSAQVALYATATHMWNPTARTWEPMPKVRQDHALIVHLPSDADWCTIHPIDVALGLDNAMQAVEIRRTRARGKLPILKASTWQPPALVMQPAIPTMDADPHDVWRAWLVDRIETIKAFDAAARQLAAAWPAGVPTFKRADRHHLDELAAIEAAVNQIERAHQLPFPASRPAGIPALDDAHSVAA